MSYRCFSFYRDVANGTLFSHEFCSNLVKLKVSLLQIAHRIFFKHPAVIRSLHFDLDEMWKWSAPTTWLSIVFGYVSPLYSIWSLPMCPNLPMWTLASFKCAQQSVRHIVVNRLPTMFSELKLEPVLVYVSPLYGALTPLFCPSIPKLNIIVIPKYSAMSDK